MALSLRQFGEKVKEKYPQYQNVPPEELAQKVLEKYPVYRSSVTTIAAGEAPQLAPTKKEGLMSRAAKFLAGSAFGSTLGTAATVAIGEAGRINQAAVQESESRRQLATLLKRPGVSEEQKRRIRSQLAGGQQLVTAERVLPDIQKTTKQILGEAGLTALGMASAGTLAGASPVTGLIPRAVQATQRGIAFGGLGGVAGAMAAGKEGREIAKAGLLGGAIGGAIGGTLSLAGGTIGAARKNIPAFADKKSETIYQNVLKMTPTEIQKETAQGKNTPKLLRRLGLVGSREEIAEQLGNMYDSKEAALQNVLTNRAKAGVTISTDEIEEQLLKGLQEYKTHVSEYSQIEDAIKTIVGNTRRLHGDQISVDVANEIKRALWKDSFNIAGTQVVNEAKYEAGSTVKSLIEKAIPEENIAAMNRELGEFVVASKQLQRSLTRRLSGKMSTYLGSILGGTIFSGSGPLHALGGAVTGSRVDQILQNPTIRTNIAQMLYRASQAGPAKKSLLEQRIRDFIMQQAELRTGTAIGTAGLIPKPIE